MTKIEDTLQQILDENRGEPIAIVLDSTITVIKILRTKLNKAEDRLKKLNALEAFGVDNWEWYGDAMSSIDSDEGEDNE